MDNLAMNNSHDGQLTWQRDKDGRHDEDTTALAINNYAMDILVMDGWFGERWFGNGQQWMVLRAT